MIKSIVAMSLLILSTIQVSCLVLPPTFQTPWMHGNTELRMAGDKHAAGLLIAFLSRETFSQRAQNLSSFTNHSGKLWLGKDTLPPIP
jgi:hypothetical protein